MIKILFTCDDMSIGGVQKSLIALLSRIDYSKYDVHLMLASTSGDLINEIPDRVKTFEAPTIISYPKFSRTSIKRDIAYLVNNKKFIKEYVKAFRYAIKYSSKMARQKYWEFIKNSINPCSERLEEYDVIISYEGGIGIWNQFIIDKLYARKKICWIHGDYSVFGTLTKEEKEYIINFDEVITVSDKCKLILIKEIPQLKDKTSIIHNIVDKRTIEKYANLEKVYNEIYNGVRFVSISRLDINKGFDLSINAFSKAVQSGYDIKWDIIGDGPEKSALYELIKKLNLQNRVRLLGNKINPYPYLKEADVFFHPSKGEGKSISVDEAKLMAKPILITVYPTVGDQIQNNITGRIVPITIDGLCNGIIEMATNSFLRESLANNLRSFDIDAIGIIEEITTHLILN